MQQAAQIIGGRLVGEHGGGRIRTRTSPGRRTSMTPSMQAVGDGLDDVGHVLAAAVVPGEDPPVLQMGDAVLDADTAGGVGLALAFMHFLVPVRGVLLELAMRWRAHTSARRGSQPLVAGVGQDLREGPGCE